MSDKPEPLLKGPKRQHIVPKFYQEGFVRDGLIAVYDRKKNETRRQQPLNTAVIGHYYTMVDEEGRQRFELEQLLSELEGNAKPTIDALIAGQSISDQQRAHMSEFVAVCAVRTPSMVDSIKHMSGEMMRRIAQIDIHSPERAKKVLQETGGPLAEGGSLDEQAEMLYKFLRSDDYVIETDHQYAVGTAIGIANEVAPVIFGRRWQVVRRPTDKTSFITSDAPVVLTTLLPRPNTFYGVGFGSPDALVMFPLSEDCLLLIYGSGTSLHHVVAPDTAFVRRFNLRLAHHSRQYLYGRDEAHLMKLAKQLRLADAEWEPLMKVN